MRRLRAGREARSARTRAPAARGVRRGRGHARIAREVEVVVGGKDGDAASGEVRFGTRRAVERAARPREARRGDRREVGGEPVEPALRRGRRERRHVLDEDGRVLQEADRLGDLFARTAVEEDASAVRVAFLLDDGDALVADRPRRDVARHVAGIVRDADLADDAGRVLHLRRQDDRLGVVVLARRGALEERLGVVHVGRAHAARGIRLEPLEGVRVEEHCAAQAVAFGEFRQDLVAARDARAGEELGRAAASLRGGARHVRGDGKGGQADDLPGPLDLDVDEIRLAPLVRECARDKRRRGLGRGLGRHDLLRAGDMPPRLRRAHLDGIQPFGHGAYYTK